MRRIMVASLLLTLLAFGCLSRPANAVTALGVNMDLNEDYSATQLFTDVAKQARDWDKVGELGLENAPRDSNGWPTTDFTGIFVTSVGGAWSTTPGTYKITFTGSATMVDTSGALATVTNQVYNAGTNTTTADYNVPSNQPNVWITFSNTKRTSGGATNTGITGLRIIRPGYPADGSVTFTNWAVAQHAKFQCLRVMDPLNTNWSTPAYPGTTDWTQRRQPGYAIQNTNSLGHTLDGRSTGIAWEYLIQFANTCNTDIWINVPTAANDNYVTQLATLLKNTFHAGGHVYVELGNELWNGAFTGAGYMQSQASALGIGWFEQVGNRSAQISNLFKNVYGAGAINTTVRVVVPGQMANTGTITQAADYIKNHYGPVNTFVYGLTGAAYFNSYGETGQTVPAILTALQNYISNTSLPWKQAWISTCASYGVLPICYEGGPDTAGGDAAPVSVKNQANVDPGMTNLLLSDMNTNWFNIGGGLFMFYKITSSYDASGEWGLSYLPNDMSTSKWAAVNQLLGSTAPGAPGSLTATPGNAQVSLTWNASSGATSYNVKRSTINGSGYATISSPAGTSYTNTGLTNGTTYYYVVTAVNASGESANSAQASATPTAGGTIPPVPTGLTATAGNAQAVLSWSASTGATSYNVSRSTVSGSGYASVATGIAATSYTNTGLTNGTTYYFVVSATNSTGTSANSAQASATPAAGGGGGVLNRTGWVATASQTNGASTANKALDGDVATVWDSGANQVPGIWFQLDMLTAQSFNQVVLGGPAAPNNYYFPCFYALYVSNDAVNWGSAVATGSQSTPGATTISFAAQTARYLKIQLTQNGLFNGNGWMINEINVYGSGPAIPPAPTGLTATAGNAQVALSWNASTGATSYNLKRSTVNGSGYATVASPTVTSYANTGLTNGTTYYYVATAVNAGGESGNSSQASATPAAAGGGPLNRTGWVATASQTNGTSTANKALDGDVATLWDSGANQVPGIWFQLDMLSAQTFNQVVLGGPAAPYNYYFPCYYALYVSNDAVNWGSAVATGTQSTPGATTIAFTNRTARYLKIQLTQNGLFNGNGWMINEINVYGSGAAIPPTPTGLTATNGNTQVALSWIASSGATSYNVKRSTVSGSGYAAVASPTGVSYTNTGLTNGTTYYYVVSAVNSSGESPNSAQVSGTPYAVAITNTATAPVIDGIVDAAWSSATAYSMANLISGPAITAADNSGTFKAMWDATNLYVLFQITDDVKKNDSTISYDDDAVEVFIDGNFSHGTVYDNVDDVQYVFGWGDTTFSTFGITGHTAGITFAKADPTGTTYNIEIKIPWTTIGGTATVGRIIGFDGHIDDDDDGAARDNSLAYSDTNNTAYANPSVFAAARLN